MNDFFIGIALVVWGIGMIVFSYKYNIEASALTGKYRFRFAGVIILLLGIATCYSSIKCGFCNIF